MSREIKFRAWDKRSNKMFYDETPDEDSVLTDTLSGINGPLSDDNFYGWMQYTGLKDKNGKEIYEGDIVSRELLDKRTGKYFLAKAFGPHKRVVKWDTSINGWNFRIRNRVSKYPIKVIGNIYENPELLK